MNHIESEVTGLSKECIRHIRVGKEKKLISDMCQKQARDRPCNISRSGTEHKPRAKLGAKGKLSYWTLSRLLTFQNEREGGWEHKTAAMCALHVARNTTLRIIHFNAN